MLYCQAVLRGMPAATPDALPVEAQESRNPSQANRSYGLKKKFLQRRPDIWKAYACVLTVYVAFKTLGRFHERKSRNATGIRSGPSRAKIKLASIQQGP